MRQAPCAKSRSVASLPVVSRKPEGLFDIHAGRMDLVIEREALVFWYTTLAQQLWTPGSAHQYHLVSCII